MKRSYERQQPSPIAPTTTGLWIDAEPQTPISNNKQLKFSVDNILNIVGQKSNGNFNRHKSNCRERKFDSWFL